MMKSIYRIFLCLLAVCLFSVGAYAYGGHGKMVTLITVMNETDFTNASGAFDNLYDCRTNNAYVNAGKEGVMWVNLGAQYYVEGMEILFRYEGGQDLGVGVWAECYENYNTGSPLSSWYNDSSVATSDGTWRDIHFKSGSKTVKTQFVKIWLNNKNYTSAVGVGEICIYATPAPGVELEPKNMSIKESNAAVVGPNQAIDNDTQQHAYVEPYQNGYFWIELDQPYAIAAVQLDVHSETKEGASLSSWVYFTPEGGTSSGNLGQNGPADKNLAFFRGSGHQTYDRVPYSAQYAQDNMCKHHRTHWYTMTHTDGHLGTKAKYVYVVVDNSNNDKPMCIDDIHIFRSYDLASDCITLSGEGLNPNTYSMAYNGEIQHPKVITVTGKQKVVTPNGENITVSYTTTTLRNDPYNQYYTAAAYSDYVIHFPVDSKEPGRYAVTVEGRGIYTGTATAYYNIKYPSEIVLDRDFVRFINVNTGAYNTHKVNIMLTTGDGAITVESSDTSLFTASLSGMTATLTKTVSYTEKTEATAYLTFRMAETEIYAATSVTIPVMFVLHYLPVGQYVDLSTATLANNSNFGSREDGIDTDDEILNLVRDKNKGSYALTESAKTRSYFDIILPEPIDICDLTIRYATSFPGDIVVHIQMSDINGEKPVPDFRTETWCDQAHRTMRVWPQNVPVIKGVKSFRVIVDTEQPQEGQHKAHIYEVGVYSPVTRDIVVEPNPEDRFLNEVPMVQTTQVMQSHIDIMKELNVAILDNTSDPYFYTPGVLYVPQTKYFTWTHTGGTYGSAENGTYTRKSPYKDALCVLRDYFTYEAMTNGILFMRGNMTVCTGQDMVHGDNTTINVLDTNVNIITYTGDWQTGDGEKRFEHAKYVHVEEGKEAKATFNVYLAVSERIEITTDIGPYQGRANVTLSLGDTVYCTDYIDGFFPVAYQNADTYKVSNMTGQAQNEINNYRNDYWHPGQVNTFTAPEDGVYTVEITVPWDSYLVSGLGGKYTTDAPASMPCTVINKVEKLKANEEWNFSFSDTQKFVFQDADVNKCTTEIENGCLKITALGNDHFAYTIDHLNFDASSYKGIEVIVSYDIKNLYYTQTDGVVHQDKAQIFFNRTDSGSMNQAMSVAVPLETASTDGKFIVLEFPMAQNAEWTGTIRRLRFDLNNGPQGTHRIRAIRLVRHDE